MPENKLKKRVGLGCDTKNNNYTLPPNTLKFTASCTKHNNTTIVQAGFVGAGNARSK